VLFVLHAWGEDWYNGHTAHVSATETRSRIRVTSPRSTEQNGAAVAILAVYVFLSFLAHVDLSVGTRERVVAQAVLATVWQFSNTKCWAITYVC
jgi:hypothetical protein